MDIIELAKDTTVLLTALGILSSAVLAWSAFVYRVYKRVRKIHELLTPNGGTSLADQIRDIRDEQIVGTMRQQIVWANLEVGYYECDTNGMCVYANQKLCDLFGLSHEQMKGNGWLKAISGTDERSKVWRDWQSALKHELPYEACYKVRNQINGEVFKCRTVAYICRNKQGEPIWYF